MTPRDAAATLIADSLERGLPLDDGLGEMNGALAIRAAAKQGQVGTVLLSLGVDAEVSRVAERWPKMLAGTLRRLEEQPSGFAWGLHVTQTAAYVLFLTIVQLAVATTLERKVMPVLQSVAKGFGSVTFLDFAQVTSALFLCALAPLFLWLAAGAVGWKRMPGWGRELERAKLAAIGAALLESGAPDDVRADYLARQKWLGDPALDAVDLDTVRTRLLAQAEQKLEHFVVTARVVSLALLTLNALGTLVAVYATIARLPLGAM